jgi:hypothetical protein
MVTVEGFGETVTALTEGDVGGVGGVDEEPPPPQPASRRKRLLPIEAADLKTRVVIVQGPIRIFNRRRGLSGASFQFQLILSDQAMARMRHSIES